MKTIVWSVLALFALLFVHKSNASNIPIGVGDELVIVVFNEPELTFDARIGESGAIKFPLIGQLDVVGKTPQDVTQELTTLLEADYLVSPQVSVTIKKYRPFYIKGEVKLAGAYEYVIGLTVDQAIAIAGGLSQRASTSKWEIVRGLDKQTFVATAETVVLPGDIIQIPESFF